MKKLSMEKLSTKVNSKHQNSSFIVHNHDMKYTESGGSIFNSFIIPYTNLIFAEFFITIINES